MISSGVVKSVFILQITQYLLVWSCHIYNNQWVSINDYSELGPESDQNISKNYDQATL